MATYHFLGAHSAISGPDYARTLTKFGESIDLTEEQAMNHAVHGCRLLPADEFASIGFNSDELELNSDLWAHDVTADEAFLVKRTTAFEAADQFRARALSAPATKD